MAIALISFGVIFSANTSEKVTKLNSAELNNYFEVELKNAEEIGHVQSAEALLELQDRFDIDEELAYVRSYKENDLVTSVLVTVNNEGYVQTEKVENSMDGCGCNQAWVRYHVTGDPFYCARACDAPGP